MVNADIFDLDTGPVKLPEADTWKQQKADGNAARVDCRPSGPIVTEDCPKGKCHPEAPDLYNVAKKDEMTILDVDALHWGIIGQEGENAIDVSDVRIRV